MAPRPTLSAFLATARAALTAPPAQRPNPLTLVVGNESADLDSLCSTLLLAYLRSHAPPHRLHVPLAHLRAADLGPRPEFLAVLRRAGAAPGELLTLDDLPPPDRLPPEATRWVLVDHNRLAGPALAPAYADRVAACVDHHADEGATPAAGRVLATCGSCASLVVDRGRAAWEEDLEADPEIDAQLAWLALGPALVDTANLGDPHKTTALDEAAVAFAEARIRRWPGAGGDYDRTAFFRELARLKSDLSGLGVQDILRKDYKQFSSSSSSSRPLTLGTSSVPRDLGFLVAKAGGDGAAALARELDDWAARKHLGLVAVLTAFQDGDRPFARELLLLATDPAAVRAARAFARARAGELRLAPWGDGALDATEEGGTRWRRCWRQGAVGNSRKQIAPMLREAMEEEEEEEKEEAEF
ncbi:exopolyphosphatase [Xylariomycetidae sp. FL0641]|nr:exopolyphosphatase [Xylariomycetidae sp. FL0641]